MPFLSRMNNHSSTRRIRPWLKTRNNSNSETVNKRTNNANRSVCLSRISNRDAAAKRLQTAISRNGKANSAPCKTKGLRHLAQALFAFTPD